MRLRNKKFQTGLVAVATVCALTLSGCAGTTKSGAKQIKSAGDEVVAKVDATVEQAMQNTKSTQAIVGVWLPDGKAYVRGYGDGVNARTAIRAAETTSPMMCALLLGIAEDGYIKLDQKVSKDLKHQPSLGDVTYEQLCNGASGFADYTESLRYFTAVNPDRPWQSNELFAQSLAHSPLPYAGVNRYLSDADPILIGRAARLKTARSTENLMREYVYDKAGLEDTFYPDLYSEDDQLPRNTMQPIAYPGGVGEPACEAEPQRIERVSPSFVPGGATVTTVYDIHDFYQALFKGKYGKKKDFELLNQPASLVNPPRDDQGNPTEEVQPVAEGEIPHREIVLGAEKVGPLYGRTGWLPGTVSGAYIDPETGFMLIIALNNSSVSEGAADAALLKLAADLAPESGVAVPWSVETANNRFNEFVICAPTPEQAPEEEEE